MGSGHSPQSTEQNHFPFCDGCWWEHTIYAKYRCAFGAERSATTARGGDCCGSNKMKIVQVQSSSSLAENKARRTEGALVFGGWCGNLQKHFHHTMDNCKMILSPHHSRGSVAMSTWSNWSLAKSTQARAIFNWRSIWAWGTPGGKSSWKSVIMLSFTTATRSNNFRREHRIRRAICAGSTPQQRLQRSNALMERFAQVLLDREANAAQWTNDFPVPTVF